jgi:hypothetical protein
LNSRTYLLAKVLNKKSVNFREKLSLQISAFLPQFRDISPKFQLLSSSNSGFGAGRIALEALAEGGGGGGIAGFHFETGRRERLQRRFVGAEEWMGN